MKFTKRYAIFEKRYKNNLKSLECCLNIDMFPIYMKKVMFVHKLWNAGGQYGKGSVWTPQDPKQLFLYLFGGHLPSRSPLQTERLLCLSTFGFFTCTTSPQPPSPRLRNLTRMLRKTTSSWHLPWASPEGRVRTPRYCLGVSLGCTFRSCGGGASGTPFRGEGNLLGILGCPLAPPQALRMHVWG